MNSIRRKLFIQIGSIALLFILLLYIANTFLLESFYVGSTKARIIGIYEDVNAMSEDQINSETLYELLYNSRTFMELAIIDEENKKVYLPSNRLFQDNDIRDLPINFKLPPVNLIEGESIEDVNANIHLINFTDPKNNSTFYILTGHLDNGWRIEIRVPLASISENVDFFNQFILIAGGLILMLTFIAANYISKHFTKPILGMFQVTDSIKKLDFSETCQVTTNDEIGKLAENINEMSYALEENITNLETSNESLKEEIAERLKIDDQRKALLNNVSHELKTPLSLIQGYSEGLQVNLHNKPEKVDFYCDVIIDEAKKMDALVSQLLDINHIQFGDFPLYKEKTGAKDFLEYIIHKQEPFIDQASINFTADLSLFETQPDLDLYIDSLRSEQIIMNLLNNAIAYVDERKLMTLSLEEISNSGLTEEDGQDVHIRLTISNTYKQIDVSEMDKWWNSFYKEDKARTRENGGYGLGLSIIKAIQEADHNQYGAYYKDGFIHFYVDFDIMS